ncbi:MAG: NDP-sugar synthase [Nitriliruptoraceae bacterium]
MSRPVRIAMIVAGGAGTRLAPLTLTTPKPLLPFCGRPFLEGVIRRLVATGVERVLLIVGADTAPFHQFAAKLSDGLAVVIEVVEEPEPLDTAGGVCMAAANIDETFFVLNGDILTDLDLVALADDHRRKSAMATLALTRVDDTSSFGVCVLSNDRIVDFVEKPAAGTLEGHDTVNAGTYVLEPEVFAGFSQGRISFEREVFPALVERGDLVVGHATDAFWADLGTPSRYLDGHRSALAGDLVWPSLADVAVDSDGIRRADGAEVDPTARLIGPVYLGQRASIGRGATVGPNVVVGDDSIIGDDVRVTDCVVHERVLLATSVTEALIGADCVLAGPVKVGRDVVLGAGVKLDRGVVPDGARWTQADARKASKDDG